MSAMPTFRLIQPDEWPRYRDLRLRALLESPDAFGSTHALESARPDDLWAARIADAAVSPRDLALFAEVNGAPCGLAWCKIFEAEPGVAHLFQMWVAPECRGQGLGGQLLKQAIAWAPSAGAHTLRLGVTVADSPAVRLYRAHGFAPVGPLEPLREGSALVAMTMELALAAD